MISRDAQEVSLESPTGIFGLEQLWGLWMEPIYFHWSGGLYKFTSLKKKCQ